MLSWLTVNGLAMTTVPTQQWNRVIERFEMNDLARPLKGLDVQNIQPGPI
jgi:hypothetical protein